MPTRYQLVKEFILLFNLYGDRGAGQFKSVDIHSDTAVVIKYSDEGIRIRKHELRKIPGLKEKAPVPAVRIFLFQPAKFSGAWVTRCDFTEVIEPGYQWIIDYQDDHALVAGSWVSNARLL